MLLLFGCQYALYDMMCVVLLLPFVLLDVLYLGVVYVCCCDLIVNMCDVIICLVLLLISVMNCCVLCVVCV